MPLAGWQSAMVSGLAALTERGKRILRENSTLAHDNPLFDVVEWPVYEGWRVSALAFLTHVYGAESVYVREFDSRCQPSKNYVAEVKIGIEILESAKEGVELGLLGSVESLVSSDVFSDFLAIAEHLLGSGYKDPAASLAGAVLENGLRRAVRSRGIPVKEEDDLSTLDQKLYQAKVYSLLDRKQIQVWVQLRNDADHGHFDRYDAGRVSSMIDGVTALLSRLLGSEEMQA